MNKLLRFDAEEVLGNVLIDGFQYKHILITGGSGLLGVNIIAALRLTCIKFKCVVIIKNSPEKYFTELFDDDRFEFIQEDLIGFDFNEIKYKFDIIFHLATYGQPAKFMGNQLDTIKLNTTITIELFKLLNYKGKFLYLSTSELYSGLTYNHREIDIGTTNTTHPRACYIESKRCGETICNIHNSMDYEVKIIRLCLAYGAGVKKWDGRAVNTFIFEALTSKNIALLDDGSAIRSYLYISDAIEMIFDILFDGKELIYNVGGIEQITILELANKIADILNISVNVNYHNDKNLNAPNKAVLDINKYIGEFKKSIFVDIEEGLKRTIEWWKFLLME